MAAAIKAVKAVTVAMTVAAAVDAVAVAVAVWMAAAPLSSPSNPYLDHSPHLHGHCRDRTASMGTLC